MRISLPVLVAPATLVAIACSGGPNTTNPLNMRDPAPSGMDPAPASGSESAPSSWESAPSSEEAPPANGDPANQMGGGGGGCVPCTGTYSCTATGGKGDSKSLTLSLTMANGKCGVDGLTGVMSLPTCGTGESTVTEQGVTGTLTRQGSGFEACVTLADGGMYCATCTPSTGNVTPLLDAGQVTIDTPGGGSGCSALSACCGNLTGVLATACTETVSLGNAASCSAAMSTYCDG